MKPISPNEVADVKKTLLPDFVIRAWNEVIAKNYINERANFTQDEIVSKIIVYGAVDRHAIYTNKWLDVEDIYRAEGWSVEYDKPAYCESYDANFTFRKKKK